MGKKQKQQKRLINELEHALAQTLSDWAIERQANRSLREVIVNDRQRHAMVVNALTNGMRRITEERDAALADVAELLRDEEASTSCIRDLRRFVAQLQEERDAALEDVQELLRDNEAADSTIRDLRKGLEVLGGVADMFERDLAAVKAQYYAVSEALDLELEYSAKTIGELRALVEQQRNDWSGDVSAAREIIARKTEEYIKLRRDSADTISELRGDLAKVRGDLERVTEFEYEAAKWRGLALVRLRTIVQRDAEIQLLKNQWQHAEDLLQARELELDALRDQQAQQEHAEPVVTLEAIKELEEGERLIDDDGVIIECEHVGYGVYPKIGTPYFLPGPQTTLDLYEQLKAKTMQ